MEMPQIPAPVERDLTLAQISQSLLKTFTSVKVKGRKLDSHTGQLGLLLQESTRKFS